MKKQIKKTDIAIIGISGKFPKSDDVTAFWKNLTEGNDLIHFYSEDELSGLGVRERTRKNPNYVNAESKLDNPGNFDYALFGYTKDEAALMDPQVRIMHEQAWSALEDAGYNPLGIKAKVGVFFGAGDDLNWRAHALLAPNETVSPFYLHRISNKNYINTLISYSLNLKGPSYYVDTACSTSLVAVHLACRNLLMKECAMALAGGVYLNTNTEIGYQFEEGLIFSKDGYCRAFDAQSSGTIGGEGAGIVVLKRYEDAVNDRDHIYAVIRASVTNNDGKRKVGYTAPSVLGQYECISLAHRIAEITPESVSYVEAHGTGTRLGDPIEIEALNKAFNHNTAHRCAIGTVKSNMGHLDAAAGVAGLIKTALAIQHKMIPPSLHYDTPNPEIDFAAGPFYVNNTLLPWESKDDAPLRAGVSSFGIGGTNAHVVLEAPGTPEQGSDSRPHKLMLYSAKTRESLQRYRTRLLDFLQNNAQTDLADLAYTLQTGRTPFENRAFFTCRDQTEAIAVLNGSADVPVKTQTARAKRQVVFMFSGSGSQYLNMGRDLYAHEPFFKQELDRGLAQLQEKTGRDYAKILFNTAGTNSVNEINNNEHTQPLLFIFEHALAKLIMKWGVKPTQMIGHSTGEYVAACLSGVFSFEAGLALVLKRAQLMSKTPPGRMLSVRLPASKLTPWLNPKVTIAAVNSPEFCVVSGRSDDIDDLANHLDQNNVPYSKLRVSVAGHSPLMESIIGEFRAEVAAVRLSEPGIPFISNLTGKTITKEQVISPEYWVQHLQEAVQFSDGIATLLAEPNSIFIEIGPGDVLTSFLKQHEKEKIAQCTLINLVRHPEQETDDQKLLAERIGELWLNGIEINWEAYYESEERYRISAPTYSFDASVFPVRVNPLQHYAALDSAGLDPEADNDIANWVFKQGWQETAPGTKPVAHSDWTLCFLDDTAWSNALARELKTQTKRLIVVRPGHEFSYDEDDRATIHPGHLEDYNRLAAIVLAEVGSSGRIIHGWGIANDGPPEEASGLSRSLDLGYYALLNIARALFRNTESTKIDLTYLVTDLFKVSGSEKIFPEKSLALGALKVIPKEYENITCRCVEFLSNQRETDPRLLNRVFAHLAHFSREEIIALRGRKSWKQFFERLELDDAPLAQPAYQPGGLYVISGANGGMAKTLSQHLLAEYGARLLLIGRSQPDEQVRRMLEENPAAVQYLQDDLHSPEALANKIKPLLEGWGGAVAGVFHTAGLGDYAGLIKDRSREDCQELFLPKVLGTKYLFDALQPYHPAFFILCSSISALQAPFGNVGYTAANTYQNFFALANESDTKVTSILWDTWKEVGMGVEAGKRFQKSDSGENSEYGMTNRQGLDLFQYAVGVEVPELIISMLEINLVLAHAREYTIKNVLEYFDQSAKNAEIVARPQLSVEYVAPATATERKLCEIWESFLGHDRIGVEDDFFELGMDSLKAMTVGRIIFKTFNVEISLKEFYKRACIKGIAKEIELALAIGEIQAPQANKRNEITI